MPLVPNIGHGMRLMLFCSCMACRFVIVRLEVSKSRFDLVARLGVVKWVASFSSSAFSRHG